MDMSKIRVPRLGRKMAEAKMARKADMLRQRYGAEVNDPQFLINQGFLRQDTSPDGRKYVLCDTCSTPMKFWGKTVQGEIMSCPMCGAYKITNKKTDGWRPQPLI